MPLFLVQSRGRLNPVLVDEEDAHLLIEKGWWLFGKGYLGRQEGGRRNRHTVYLHREILGLGSGRDVQVDHINGNPLDNRRANLRAVTPSQNQQNRSRCSGSALSGLRGVRPAKTPGKWVAEARLNGRQRYLGTFASVEAAADAVAAWRAEHMPFSPDARRETSLG